MKKAVFYMSVLVFLCFGLSAHAAAKPTKIEVLYMNHGPLEETLDKIKGVFSKYGDKLAVSWYDFDSREGEQFMAKKGVRQHLPLVIWIDDSPVVTVGVKKVEFKASKIWRVISCGGSPVISLSPKETEPRSGR